MMKYIGEIIVNGFLGIESGEKLFYEELCMFKDLIIRIDYVMVKNVLDVNGVDVLVEWIKGQENLLLMDMIFRDVY